MARPIKLALSSTLLGILGWHGVFLLLLIVAFKLFLWEQGNYACPCTWSAAYGTIMFLFPSVTSYMIAFFAYLRQDNDSVPWKVLKKLYELKFSCHQYDERTPWDSHSQYCFRCRQLKRDWGLVKFALSAVFSFLYPLVWLSLSFLQAYYYVCIQVGPSRAALTRFCNAQVQKPDEYDRSYGLAIIHSKSIGSVMLLCTLFLMGVIVIVYGEIENYLSKKHDWSPSGGSANLQVIVSISSELSRKPSTGSHGDRFTPTTSASVVENAETERQTPVADGSKTIRIHLSNTFGETLQGCLQDGAWQGIDIRCSQQEAEGRSHQGSFYSPFRLPSQARRTADIGYESLPQLTENSGSF